jgi:hypothetical protein
MGGDVMSKRLLGILGFVAMLALASGPVQAAEIPTPPTDEELTLHPGDTITWSPSSVHRVRFGGKVRPNTADFPTNNNVQLPSFTDIKKVLDIAPINPDWTITGDIAKAGQAQKVVATVKANAHTLGVPELIFTCGFSDGHADDMVTVSFKFAPPLAAPATRSIEIITANGPPPPGAIHRFLLKTVAGEKSLTRKP